MFPGVLSGISFGIFTAIVSGISYCDSYLLTRVACSYNYIYIYIYDLYAHTHIRTCTYVWNPYFGVQCYDGWYSVIFTNLS